MKKTNIMIVSAAILVALIGVVGIAVSSYAQGGMFAGREKEFKMRPGHNLSEEQKAELETKWQTRRTEMEAKQAEIKTALSNGYEAWVAAVKKNMGENAPILEKINEGNFFKFVEANGYLEQAKAIFVELGIEGGQFGEKGIGGGHGFGCLKNSDSQEDED